MSSRPATLVWLHAQNIARFDYTVKFIYLFSANRKVLVNMNEDSGFTSTELPDGMTIDLNGNLWVAMFNGARIVNIDGQTG